jgi:hypothetical protein
LSFASASAVALLLHQIDRRAAAPGSFRPSSLFFPSSSFSSPLFLLRPLSAAATRPPHSPPQTPRLGSEKQRPAHRSVVTPPSIAATLPAPVGLRPRFRRASSPHRGQVSARTSHRIASSRRGCERPALHCRSPIAEQQGEKLRWEVGWTKPNRHASSGRDVTIHANPAPVNNIIITRTSLRIPLATNHPHNKHQLLALPRP